MKIVNLTSHDIVFESGGIKVTFPPSGTVARVDGKTESGTINYSPVEGVSIAMPYSFVSGNAISNLPEPEAGTYFIVSNYVAQIARRKDLIAPDTGATATRDEQGNVVSIKIFQTY